jgi:hypothetical protein
MPMKLRETQLRTGHNAAKADGSTPTDEIKAGFALRIKIDIEKRPRSSAWR